MRFQILTLFPEFFPSALSASLIGKAAARGLIAVDVIDIRGFAGGAHRVADDAPYGGGQGMVLKVEPVVAAIEAAAREVPQAGRLLLSPRGRPLTQALAEELAKQPALVLVCGHYEGIDERVRQFVDDEVSIGDYVLAGGETAALVVVDAVSRLLPGFVGNAGSLEEESFEDGLLEYPQYTRPEVFRDVRVPPTLLSGDHAAIERWRRKERLRLTRARRPDLLARARLSDRDRALLRETGSDNFSPGRLSENTRVPSEKLSDPVSESPLYVVLLHHPVYDKHGKVVATAVTNMDVHDLARIGKTYGVRGVFIATPVRALRLLAEKIIEHWRTGFGAEYNETRREALSLVRTVVDLDGAILEIEREAGERPTLIATSAKAGDGRVSFAAVRDRLEREGTPHLLILGTGWGLTREIIDRADLLLEPIRGVSDYNHLPVRAAAAIMLDRLVG